jgi:hypothetical protein
VTWDRFGPLDPLKHTGPVRDIGDKGRTTKIKPNRGVTVFGSLAPPDISRSALPTPTLIATALVYMIIVSGKIARPSLPLFVPLLCTCGICRLPSHIASNSYSSPPRMSQIDKNAQSFHAALEELPPERFDSVYLFATYQTHGLKS